MLYFALVRSKLEYASVAWSSVTLTDSNKLERTQKKSAALCHNRFSQDSGYLYDKLLERLRFLTLYNRRRHFYAFFFLINAFTGTKCCPLSSKYSTFGFLLGTFVSSTRSLVPLAATLQLGGFEPQMQFLNLQIPLENLV